MLESKKEKKGPRPMGFVDGLFMGMFETQYGTSAKLGINKEKLIKYLLSLPSEKEYAVIEFHPMRWAKGDLTHYAIARSTERDEQFDKIKAAQMKELAKQKGF